MVMTEACRHVADVHDRMPVILARTDWSDWLNGAPDAAGLLCRPYPELPAPAKAGEGCGADHGAVGQAVGEDARAIALALPKNCDHGRIKRNAKRDQNTVAVMAHIEYSPSLSKR